MMGPAARWPSLVAVAGALRVSYFAGVGGAAAALRHQSFLKAAMPVAAARLAGGSGVNVGRNLTPWRRPKIDPLSLVCVVWMAGLSVR